MFERFTDNARGTVRAAVATAGRLGDDHVGAEHLLLALAAPGGGAASILARSGVTPGAAELALAAVRRGRRPREDGSGDGGGGPTGSSAAPARRAPDEADAEALLAIGIDLAEIRRRAEAAFGRGALDIRPGTGRHLPFTRDAKRVLERAVKAALRQRSGAIGTEHLLLGLLDADPGVAMAMLEAMEVSPGFLREVVLAQMRPAS